MTGPEGDRFIFFSAGIKAIRATKTVSPAKDKNEWNVRWQCQFGKIAVGAGMFTGTIV